AALAEQVFEDALFDVEQVANPAGKEAALHPFEGLGEAAHDPGNGVLGGEQLVADLGLDLSLEGGVGQEAGVGLEGGGVLAAELGLDGLLVLAGLAGSGGEGLAEALDLSLDALGFDLAAGDAEPLRVQHEGRADGHTGRDGYATFDVHESASRAG